uniref:Uncharacterized protein LOC100373745 n=1 Tax=Saccoglossus kowalevskii TaxID=10224 RepID=A0ABM0GZM6_SACKO|nr:PREDICTED: uncharacterized protein LOC100373745 [Saccoglossus kowalevskii]
MRNQIDMAVFHFDGFMFLLVFASTVTAQNCDLTVKDMNFGDPNPNTDTIRYVTDVDTTVDIFFAYVGNNGPDNLPAGTAGEHFEIKMYISALDDSGNMDDPEEVTTYINGDSKVDELPASDEKSYASNGFTIQYHSSKCSTHSHLCLKIVKNGVYTDNDPTNDFQCLPFVKGASTAAVGLTNCQSDVIPTSISVSDPNPANFSSNEPVNATFSVNLQNAGGTKVPGSTSTSDNIAFSIFIADTVSESASIKSDLTDSLVYTWNDVSTGIDEWGEVAYDNLKVTIAIPVLDCDQYQYLCIVFEKGVNAAFDDDESNNLVCIPFSDFGSISCPVRTTTAPVRTTPIAIASTSKVISTTGGAPNVTMSEGNTGIVNIHVGVVVGIALSCAVVGAGLAFLGPIVVKKILVKINTKKVDITDHTPDDKTPVKATDIKPTPDGNANGGAVLTEP